MLYAFISNQILIYRYYQKHYHEHFSFIIFNLFFLYLVVFITKCIYFPPKHSIFFLPSLFFSASQIFMFSMTPISHSFILYHSSRKSFSLQRNLSLRLAIRNLAAMLNYYISVQFPTSLGICQALKNNSFTQIFSIQQLSLIYNQLAVSIM